MKRKPLVQRDLWGREIKPEPASAAVMPIEFEGSRLRIVMKNGEPWWLLSDAAKLLGYRDAEQAGRLVRAKHRGTTENGTPGLQAGMTIVSEGGLYRLIMRSRSAVADDFQDWVTDEVLPAIRKTGRYGVTVDRVDREQRKLRSDRQTAVARVKNRDVNLAIKAGLLNRGGCVNDEVKVHNAVYRGLFGGHTAASLRSHMGLKQHQTPLDRMSELCLGENMLAKSIAARLVRERGVSTSDEHAVYEQVAQETSSQTLRQLGPNRQHGFREDPVRGLILDVLDDFGPTAKSA